MQPVDINLNGALEIRAPEESTLEKMFASLRVSVTEFCDEVDAKITSIFNTSTEGNQSFAVFPVDVFNRIFIYIPKLRDFVSLSETCKILHLASQQVCPSTHFPPYARLFLGTDFNESAIQLGKATQNLERCMHSVIYISFLEFFGVKEQITEEKKSALTHAENIFFLSFKKRCQVININHCSKNLFQYSSAAINRYVDKLPFYDRFDANKSIISNFNKKHFDDLFESCAMQSAESITPDGFSRSLKNLQLMEMCVPRGSGSVPMEDSIRQAFHKRANFVEDLKKLIDEYNDPNGQKVADIRRELKMEFMAEIEAPEAGMFKLSGLVKAEVNKMIRFYEELMIVVDADNCS